MTLDLNDSMLVLRAPVELKTASDVDELLEVDTPAIVYALVYPEAAEYMITLNYGRNRPSGPGRVARLAAELLGNKWYLSNDALAFDPDKRLRNGRHRLPAAVRARKPIEVTIMLNVSLQAVRVYDTGKTRTPRDVFFMEGYSKNIVVPAAIRLVLDYYGLRGQLGWKGRSDHSPAELVEYADANVNMELLEEKVREAESTKRGGLRTLNSSAFAAMLYLAASQADAAQAEVFAARIRTGENLQSDDSELLLRRLLLNLRERDEGYRSPRWHLGVYIKAWNYRRKGTTTDNIRFKENERFPTLV